MLNIYHQVLKILYRVIKLSSHVATCKLHKQLTNTVTEKPTAFYCQHIEEDFSI